MTETGKTYHLYNRGNNKENLFYKPENYYYFLRQFNKYLAVFIDVYAYCLLPNHFHFLIRIKEEEEMGFNSSHLASLKDLPSVISNQFRIFFMSYSKAINKQENRTGSLFQKIFKVKEVSNDEYFSQLVFYIHANPQLHGLTNDFKKWKYSSYHPIMIDDNSILKKVEVLEWFGNIEEYKRFHKSMMDFRNVDAIVFDN